MTTFTNEVELENEEEVEVPEGYTSFNQNRFVRLISTDSDEWTEEMEQQYWEEQPNIQIFKIWG